MSCYSSKRKETQTNYLDKRVPDRRGFDHVRSKIDTGTSMRKYLETVTDLRTHYRYKKDEIFKRMKLTTFIQLVLQIEQMKQLNSDIQPAIPEEDEQEILENGGGEPAQTNLRDLPMENGQVSIPNVNRQYSRQCDSARTSRIGPMTSVISGIGQMDIDDRGKVVDSKWYKKQQALFGLDRRIDDSCPYLLLDLRTDEEFSQSHIITAQHYPATYLSRDRETLDILAYKNKEGKVIIVYDNDETIGCNAAHVFTQRGYENLFLLSGGMKLAYTLFPSGLIAGTVPKSFIPDQHKPGTSRRSTGPPKTKRAEKIVPATQTSFTHNDLDQLQENLQDVQLPLTTRQRSGRSSTASRYTDRSSTSRKSYASSRLK